MSEASINSLHRELHTLTRVLTEAKVYLEQAPEVLDVEEYLKNCEVSNRFADRHVSLINPTLLKR